MATIISKKDLLSHCTRAYTIDDLLSKNPSKKAMEFS